MSQSTVPEQLPTAPPKNERNLSESRSPKVSPPRDPYELDYQPVPVMALVALFLGIASFFGLMGLFGLVLAFVGILVSLGSYFQIRASQGLLSGTKMSVIGGALSAFFLVVGSAMMYSDYRSELPPGFTRVNFPNEIAEKGFIVHEGRRELHPDVMPYVEQKVFLKGYIWQSQSYENSFVLLKDNGKCCYGGNPAPNDMIFVKLPEGAQFQYQSGLISVAGVFHANPHAPEESGEAVYVMDAEHVAKAKTVF
ncbi:MAG: DUF3299 domain-containing protein [Planctomycetaceae bacterium]|nr:DUF3299 domain-containing protein [Planctomycetaceae bacterium]